MIISYYLTEMNLLKLENIILKFIISNKISKQLKNGIISKVSEIMYNDEIDYYYPDYIATELDVDIKHVDQVYLHGHQDIYKQPLKKLLGRCELYTGKLSDANNLEAEIKEILKTKKPIQNKPRRFIKCNTRNTILLKKQ